MQLLRLFVFVGLPDDRRFVRFGVVVFFLVIIVIVGISRRHRVAHDGDEPPLGRGKVLRDALGHVGLLAGYLEPTLTIPQLIGPVLSGGELPVPERKPDASGSRWLLFWLVVKQRTLINDMHRYELERLVADHFERPVRHITTIYASGAPHPAPASSSRNRRPTTRVKRSSSGRMQFDQLKRREFMAAVCGVAAWSVAARAQPASKVERPQSDKAALAMAQTPGFG